MNLIVEGKDEYAKTAQKAIACLYDNKNNLKWKNDFDNYRKEIEDTFQYDGKRWSWKIHKDNDKFKRILNPQGDGLMEFSSLRSFIKGYTSIRYRGIKVATVNRNITPNHLNYTFIKNQTLHNTIKNNFKYDFYNEMFSASDSENQLKTIKKYCKSTYKLEKKNAPEDITERALEAMLLKEFKYGDSPIYIQPVLLPIWNLPYQFPTPLGGSHYYNSRRVTYVNNNRAGIDILARIGKGTGGKLAVIELKNLPSKQELSTKHVHEKLEDALKQAIIYTTFLVALIEEDYSKHHDAFWYHWFGKNDKTYYDSRNNTVSLCAIAAYPLNREEKDTLISEMKKIQNEFLILKGKLTYKIELHAMLIDIDNHMIEYTTLKKKGNK